MLSLRSHRWLVAFSALLLLLGTAAPALVRMDCLSSGRTVVSIGQGEDCCPPGDDHPNGTIEAVCCEFTSTVPERAAFHMETVPSVAPAFERGPEPGAAAALPLLDATKGYGLMAHPPPLLTAQRLSQVGSFLI